MNLVYPTEIPDLKPSEMKEQWWDRRKEQKTGTIYNWKIIKSTTFWKKESISNNRDNSTDYFKHVNNTFPCAPWPFLAVQNSTKMALEE